MIALRWLYEQAVRAGRVLEDRPWRPDDGGATHCWLCACPCPAAAPSQPVKVAVRDTFTNHDLARYPAGEWVCPACAWYFDHAGARADNWIPKAWAITEQDMTPLVISEMPPDDPTGPRRNTGAVRRFLEDALVGATGQGPIPLVITIPTSYKKHLLLLAQPMVVGGGVLRVQYETQQVCVHRDAWFHLTMAYDALRALGHGKMEIVSGELHPLALARHGQIAHAYDLSARLSAWRGGPALEMLSHLSASSDYPQAHPMKVSPDRASRTPRRTDPDPVVPSPHDTDQPVAPVATGVVAAAGDLAGDTQRLQEQVRHDDLATTPEPRSALGGPAERPSGPAPLAQLRLFGLE